MRSYIHKALIVLFSFAVFFCPSFAFANTLSISPASGSYAEGKIFSAQVFVSSPAQAINAVSAIVSFPNNKLQVVSVSRTGSIINLWVHDPSFSNSQGTVSFEGVVPNPGYTGISGNIVTITFKVVSAGSAIVKFDSGSVLANDGNGTDILKNMNPASYILGGATPQAPASITPAPEVKSVPDEPQANSLAPDAPRIVSSSYPDSKSWYTEKIGRFNWDNSSDVTAVRVLLSKLPKSEPTVVYTSPIDSKEIPDIEDGVWYFHVQLKNKHGWGGIAHYLFKVDATAPESFTVKELPRDDKTQPKPRFLFSAIDATSGVNHYSVQIDGGETQTWKDDGTGVFETNVLEPGKHILVARAYDETSNFAVSSVDFVIESIETPTIESYTQKVTPDIPLEVQGTAIPNISVHLLLSRSGSVAIVTTVKADNKGAFSGVFDRTISSGTYSLTAVAEDSRGAKSEPSAEKRVSVRGSWLSLFGPVVMNILTVIVPLLALAFAIVFLILWGVRKIIKFKKRIRRELREVESTVNKAFDFLKEDMEDSIHILEHAKNKRELTKEEDDLIERFRKNLVKAEKMIKKEIQDVEKKMGDR